VRATYGAISIASESAIGCSTQTLLFASALAVAIHYDWRSDSPVLG